MSHSRLNNSKDQKCLPAKHTFYKKRRAKGRTESNSLKGWLIHNFVLQQQNQQKHINKMRCLQLLVDHSIEYLVLKVNILKAYTITLLVLKYHLRNVKAYNMRHYDSWTQTSLFLFNWDQNLFETYVAFICETCIYFLLALSSSWFSHGDIAKPLGKRYTVTD